MMKRTDSTDENEDNSHRDSKPKAEWTSVHTPVPSRMRPSEDFDADRFVFQITG